MPDDPIEALSFLQDSGENTSLRPTAPKRSPKSRRRFVLIIFLAAHLPVIAAIAFFLHWSGHVTISGLERFRAPWLARPQETLTRVEVESRTSTGNGTHSGSNRPKDMKGPVAENTQGEPTTAWDDWAKTPESVPASVEMTDRASTLNKNDGDLSRSAQSAPADDPPLHGRWQEVVADYRTKAAAVTDSADDQKVLARWCDNQGLWSRAQRHWETVLARAPGDAQARERLGYVRTKGQWAQDATRFAMANQTQANQFWKQELAAYHRGIHATGRDAKDRQTRAATRLDAIADPRAVPAIWSVFAGDASHHSLIASLLTRIESRPSSEMLAALAVYSPAQKARDAAIRALRERPHAEFAAPLVGLLQRKLQFKVEHINDPVQGRGRILLIEDERANYQFLYPNPDAHAEYGFAGVGPQVRTNKAIQDFNAAQAKMAKAVSDEQIKSDVMAVEGPNNRILEMNHRVTGVLNETCRMNLGPNPQAWRRWLAGIPGIKYTPPDPNAKITIAQVVPLLFTPQFVPAPPVPS